MASTSKSVSMMKFGDRVRHLRRAKGLGQRALAKEVGISLTYVSKIENHRLDFGDYPSTDVILRIAAALEADEDELLILAEKIPQLGTVEIGDDAELGACVTVDRARFGATRIGPKVKIDNLVQIAHNVEIGEATVIVAQVAIAGSTRIGRCCQIAGQAAIDGHLVIGDGARVAAKAGVTKDVPAGTDVSGYPAVPHREHLRYEAALRQMADVLERLKRVEARLARLDPEDGT